MCPYLAPFYLIDFIAVHTVDHCVNIMYCFNVMSPPQVDIFQKKFLLIPIHLEVHWSLVCVNVHQRAVTYFDSQRTLNRRCPKVGEETAVWFLSMAAAFLVCLC